MGFPSKGGGYVRLGLALDCRAELRSPEELVVLAFNHADTSWAHVSNPGTSQWHVTRIAKQFVYWAWE